MSIRYTDNYHVALFDSVTGIAFGPIFGSRDEADAFERWLDHKDGRETDELLSASREEIKGISDEWGHFLLEHLESDCPFDGDDVAGGGWTNATDHEFHDGSPAMAYPNKCDCECHTRPGGIWEKGTYR